MIDEYIRVNNNIIAVVNLGKLLNKNNLNAEKADIQALLALDDDQIEIAIAGSSIFNNIDDFKTQMNNRITEIDFYISLWDGETEERCYNFVEML